MAGSRKGEHRGNAKPGRTKRQVIRKAGEPKRPKPNTRAYRKPHIQTEDYMRQIVAVIQGLPEGSNKMPREAMLDCQHYFQDEAAALMGYKNALIKQLETATDRLTLLEIDAQIQRVTGQIYELMRTVVDVAFKAANFYHPRFAAEHVTVSTQAPNMMAMIMEELDHASRGRPSWQRDLKLVGGSDVGTR